MKLQNDKNFIDNAKLKEQNAKINNSTNQLINQTIKN